jgi:hypothetical protein
MHRVRGLLVLALLLVPTVSHGLQLHWSSGADTLTFTEATRAILVLRADSAEVTLPPEWRLLWVGDSTEVQVVEQDSLEVCEGDTAQVYDVEGPSTPEDSTAHLVTARFCSGGSESAEQAVFQLDLPVWGRGKCKVVALDPADSTSVLESNEVTFNGGVSDPFEPVVFAASQSRSSDIVSVTAVGTGLTAVQQSSIVASDSSWVVPLALVQRTASSLTATALVPASLPPALLEVATGGGQVASAPLSGDEAMAPTGDYSYGKFHDPIPGTRPKDFSFFYDNLGHFHLFFINTIVGKSSLDPVNERYFGHTRGTDLRNDWTPPDTSFHVGTGWEAAHVWAPTLVQVGPTYYLFYTGVDAQGNQSIGVATTGNINVDPISWGNRPSSPIVSRALETWIFQGGAAQCRDPFVMRAPLDSTTYVMLYSTMCVRGSQPGDTVTTIGIAHQHANALAQPWIDDGRLEITDVPAAGLSVAAESPHALIHVNARGDTSYYVCASGNNAAFPGRDRLLRNRQSPWDVSADTTAAHWNLMSSLYDQLGFAQLDPVVFYGLEASEYCTMCNHEYIAGVDASIGVDSTYSIWITMLQWINGGSGPDVMALLGPVTDVNGGDSHEGDPRAEHLRLLGPSPGRQPHVFEMTVPRSEHVDLTIYDVSGRTVRRLASGIQLPGSWRVAWDGRDEVGGVAGSGVYFALMRWPTGAQVARVVVLR